MNPPVTELLASVALNMGDHQIIPLHVRANARKRILDQLDEELA